MKCKFEYVRYRRHFREPLQTAHGSWKVREAILVRLTDPDGACGFGEIAPIEAFGTESPDRAEASCRERRGCFDTAGLEEIPEDLPCCRFALESAVAELSWSGEHDEVAPDDSLPVAGLLPAGGEAADRARRLRKEGFGTLKWKIGVHPFFREREWFRRLRDEVPSGVRWRLDANGALDWRTAQEWGGELAGASVEFLEQPFPPSKIDDILRLAGDFPVPLALDESVGTLSSLRQWRDRGWPGLFVVKPALAGSPERLAAFLRERGVKVVFSSALESAIGMKAALGVAFAGGHERRALGWGTGDLFGDDGLSPRWGSRVSRAEVETIKAGETWKRLAG